MRTRAGPAPAEGASARIEDLLAEMTLEEKVGQMTQLTVGAVAAADSPRRGSIVLDERKLREALVERGVGSLINIVGGSLTAEDWHGALRAIQEVALRETRLGIPVVYGIDHVHGANYVVGGTLFPHNLALAASFDPDLARRIGQVTGRETAAAGLGWNFAPVMDVGRQPLWPRFYETFGEATWLVEGLGTAFIAGVEEGSEGRVATTAKHYLAYSGPTHGRDRTPALLGRRTIREQFLPAFRAAVEAGVAAVMVNSGEIDGEPVHASGYWLTDVLRGELGFDGVVVTDWADAAFLHTRHRVAPTLQDASRMVVEAGIDVAMTPDSYDFHDHVVALVRDGAVPEARIDASVRRILRLKERVGLFDRPVADPGRATTIGGTDARALALEAARATITLLHNDGVLPLDPGSRVLVTGPAAASLTALTGGWTYTWQGSSRADFPPDATTLVDEIAARAEYVDHVAGAGFDIELDPGAAAAAAGEADIAVVALGEDAYAEWAGDIRDLTLPEPQLRLAEAVIATGTPTVLVLVQGRPRVIRRIADGAAAIVLASWPGQAGARALAEVLYGETSPSGRLPFTYPRHPNDLTPHDHKFTETMDTRLEPRGPGGFDPQFELGTGLGYTTFRYDRLELARASIRPGEGLDATVEVRNTGDRAGAHTVLLFTRQHYASTTPHVRRLRGARKVVLAPGEAETVRFTVDAADLRTIGPDGTPVLEPGPFDLMVGELSRTFTMEEAS